MPTAQSNASDVQPDGPLRAVAGGETVRAVVEALAGGGRVVARGSVGSSAVQLAGWIARGLARPVVLVVAHLDEADDATDELQSAGIESRRLPAADLLAGEAGLSDAAFAERVSVCRWASSLPDDRPSVIVCPIPALMRTVPPIEALGSLARSLAVGDTVDPHDLLAWLEAAGYRRLDAIEEPGDVAVRGGIVDVFPPVAGDADGEAGSASPGVPVRIDFFGDEIDRISEIDPGTMGSDRSVSRVDLPIADTESDSARAHSADDGVNFLTLLPNTAVGVLHETMEVVEQGRGHFERLTDGRGVIGPPEVLRVLESRFAGLVEINQFSGGAGAADTAIDLPVGPLPTFERDAGAAFVELGELAGTGRAVVFCQNEGERSRAEELIAEHCPGARERIDLVERYVHRGFLWNEGVGPLAVVPYDELLGRFHARRRGGPKLRTGRAMDTFLDVSPGDYVVHSEHGIARFAGLTLMEPRRLPGEKAPAKAKSKGGTKSKPRSDADMEEYLTLEFAGRSTLHVPAMQIDLVQKYVGGFAGKPPLSTIGGKKWKAQKERVADAVRDLAGEMLRVRAAREHLESVRYPEDTAWQREFEASFPYDETEDQLAAIHAAKRDMQNTRPMDRLICGDVGFGKTEVAVRAAFKACEFGKQVAVLVPTTVLAEQHERTFRARFADYPFRVESLSRFKTTREINQTLAAVRKGAVDVVIGTHRLLSKDVRFADLGLVVIDEEQRFGVEHKEKLLQLRMTVEVLTLSATPIPRTLHMSLLGIRDISSLTTPPVDRRAIVTEVAPHNPRRIQQAIRRELSREGQVFFVHNRVHNIESVADDLLKLVPEAKLVIGHGQMAPKELEAVMLKFMRREADVLVATTIIESGIDIPTANTMIINDADRFGLSELHQLRGRVGRYKHRAYCYMLLPPDRTVTEVAQKRLKAIEQYSMLGAGFKIAMRDLEIRGAGNLLGAEQSGHIAAVGYEMYCRLLEDTVRELKREGPPPSAGGTTVEIGVTGVIPRVYIPSDARRLEAYRRLATAADSAEVDRVEEDLASAYGDPPKPVRRLLELASLRAAASALGVKTVSLRRPDVVFRMPLDRQRAFLDTFSPRQGQVTPLPPQPPDPLAEVYYRPPERYLDEAMSLMRVLRACVLPPPAPEGDDG